MMRVLRRTWLRLLGSLPWRGAERELTEELESHIAMLADENVRRGGESAPSLWFLIKPRNEFPHRVVESHVKYLILLFQAAALNPISFPRVRLIFSVQ